MASNKRKAETEASRPPRSTRNNPQPVKTPAHLATIQTLALIQCSIEPKDLSINNLDDVLKELLPRGQQHVDLWTIFESPVFKLGSALHHFHAEWRAVHSLSLDVVVGWRLGEISNSLDRWKPSGAQLATRAIKTYRWLQEEPLINRSDELRRALQLKEIDYLMFMYGTQWNNVDNMVPGHEERLKYLLQELQKAGIPRVTQPGLRAVQRIENIATSQASDEQGEIERIVEGFRKASVEDSTDLPDIIGHEGIRQQIDQLFDIPTLFDHILDPREKLGFQSVLLYGPPGTGKTLLARSLAAKRNMTFFKIDSDALTSKYVGDTEKIIRQLTKSATRHIPSIIFFDEVDGLTRRRESTEASFERRTTNAMLEMFNDLGKEPSCFIIGATNHPWDLDSAFLSRFERIVHLGLPSKNDCKRMIGKGLANKRSFVRDIHLEIICSVHTSRFSGRDIEKAMGNLNMSLWTDLMNSASFVPVEIEGELFYEPCDKGYNHNDRIDRPFSEWPVKELRPRGITYEHVQRALETVSPSVTEEDLEQYEEWSKEFGTMSVQL